jgi:general secretion pathway protein D
MRTILVFWALCLASFTAKCSLAQVAQDGRFTSVDRKVQTQLAQKIDLDLRDATIQEAVFTIRDLAKVNIVLSNDITGTVNASFTNTEVYQVLDSLLIPRGYSYRVVSGSLVILPVADVGDRLPNFASATIQLQSNSIVEMLEVVKSMLSPEGRAHSLTASSSILVMDYADRIKEIQSQIELLEHSAANRANAMISGRNGGGGNTVTTGFQTEIRVFKPQYVPVDLLMESIRPMISTTGQVSALKSEDKLIIRDIAGNLDVIEKALAELDQPRRQVRIWARIYDCALDDIKACGINLNAGFNGTALTAAGTAAQSAVLGAVTSPVASPTNGVLTMSTINRLGSFQTVVQALETAKDTRLLADPNIVVMNHEKAEIQIVTEVPFQQLTEGIQGGSFGTTSFREAGVSMDVIPHIAQDNTISLVINPKFSVLTGFSEGTQRAPIIDRREAKTTVRVENLQTLVLGGLRQRTRSVEQSGIPGLKNLPYVGRLFRYERQNARESELLVFITPELVTYDYPGSEREQCAGEHLHQEIEMTPTHPIPFGRDVLRAEQKARDKAIDNQWRRNQRCSNPDCYNQQESSGMIGGYGAR